MKWITAVKIARNYEVTYEEWCNLYYDTEGPAEDQLRLCEETAHKILVRNKVIEYDDKFVNRPRVGHPVLVR